MSPGGANSAPQAQNFLGVVPLFWDFFEGWVGSKWVDGGGSKIGLDGWGTPTVPPAFHTYASDDKFDEVNNV